MPRLISLLALCLFCVGAGAQADTAKKDATPAIVQKFESAMQNTRTLSVDIAQAVTPGVALDTAHLVMAKPNKLVLLSRLNGQTVGTLVCDGKTQWQWEQWVSNQYIKRPAPAALADLRADMPMGVSADFALALLTDPMSITLLPHLRDRGAASVGGVPARRLVSDNTTLWLAAATGMPLRVTRGSGISAVTVVFKHYTLGKAFAARTFALRPPKNLVASAPPSAGQPGRPGQAEPPLLKPGTPAPDFTLSTPGGKSVSLSSLKGQVVLIDFWATWCGPCQMAMPHVQKVYEDLGDKGLTVLSVNTWDQKPALQQWMKQNTRYTTTILFDPKDGAKSVATGKYKVSGIPTVYVIDKDGKIAASFVGYDPHGETQIKAALAKLGVE